MNEGQIARLCKRKNGMVADRGTWETHWQDAANYMLPNHADFNVKRTQGDKRTNLIYDSTGTHANELLAAGIHGMLTNPASEWFGLRLRNNPELNEIPQVKIWLEAATQTMLRTLGAPTVAFSSHLHEFYLSLCALGTAVMFIGDAINRKGLTFKTINLGEVFIAENNDGIVDTVFREFEMPLRLIVKEFGEDKLTESMKKAWNKDKVDQKFKILHCVYPREGEAPENGADRPENLPIASIYLVEKEKQLLKEGGFTSQPYMVARWTKATGENYGRGPGMTALPDVKMLQQMVKTVIRAGQKIVDPPLLVPDDGVLGPVRTVPGGLNYYRASNQARIEPLMTGGNIPIGFDMMEDVRNRIRMTFYLDQLQFTGGPQMTATEVMERTERTMRLLGPTLGRMQSEFLGPMIDRIFTVLTEQSMLPQPPEELAEQELEIEYVSPLARAQRQSDMQGIVRTFELAMPLAQAEPLVAKVIKGVEAARYIADINGVPPNLVRTDRELQAEAEKDMKAQQQMMMSELANKDADTAGKVVEMVGKAAGGQQGQ